MLKEKFCKFYGNRKISLFFRDYKEYFLNDQISIVDVEKWCNEELIEFLNTTMDSLRNVSVLTKEEALFYCSEINENLICFFKLDYNSCENILKFYREITKIRVQNFEIDTFSYSNLNLLEFIFAYGLDNSKFKKTNVLPFAFINDNKIINATPFFENAQPPFDTNERFSGLIPYLYYENFLDLYEQLFAFLLDEIRCHFDYNYQIFLNLFSFAKNEDKSKVNLMIEIKQYLHSKYPNFEWNKQIGSFIVQNYPDILDCIFTTIDEATKL